MCSEQCSNCSTFCWCCTFLKGGGKWKDAACFRLNIFNNEERHMFLPEVQPQHSPSSDARKYCCFFGGGGVCTRMKNPCSSHSPFIIMWELIVCFCNENLDTSESRCSCHINIQFTLQIIWIWTVTALKWFFFFFFMEWFFRKKHLTSNNYFYHQFICFLIFWSVNIKK